MVDNDTLLAISDLLDKKLKPMHEEQRQTNERIKHLELLLENDVLPRIQTIESCYTDTYGRYIVGIEQMEALQADVGILKKIVQEHSRKLQSM